MTNNVYLTAIHQSEDDDQFDQERIKSPFGSSIRTFDSTDYSYIGIVILSAIKLILLQYIYIYIYIYIYNT